MINTIKIKFGGKLRTLKFNMNSDAIMCEGLSMAVGEPVTLDEFNQILFPSIEFSKDDKKEVVKVEKNPLMAYQGRFIIWLYYSGLHNYYEASDNVEELEKINYHDVADWMMELDEETSLKVLNKFIQIHGLKNKSNNWIVTIYFF